MKDDQSKTSMSRREILENTGKGAAAAIVRSSLLPDLLISGLIAADPSSLNAVAGPDLVTVLPGKTYLMGWAELGKRALPAVEL